MLSAFSTRVALAMFSLLSGVSCLSFAGTITLQASANNSIQIQALKGTGGKTLWEVQFGGGSDQPPHNTVITGKASTEIGGKTCSGYYRLSTAPHGQLRMLSKSKGTKPGAEDAYTFLAGHHVLEFKFAATLTFNDPWLVAEITNASATQQVPSQGNGDQHPPILLIGSMSAPTAGSLAGSFGRGDSKLMLNIGGNQRLLDLKPTNSHSGMSLKSGTLVIPDVSERTKKEKSQREP